MTDVPISTRPIREMHLFAGCGGGILGGILLGHTCLCAVELREYRRRVLLQRQRGGIFPRFPVWDNVETFDGHPWRGRVEIVAGGFPCQNISPSGDRTGITGAKSGLWRHMARIIGEVRPAYAFVENAATLTVRGLGVVLGDLAEMGFDAKWGVLGAVDAIWLDGVPPFDHERFRCFIKATHPDRERELQSQGRIPDKRRWISDGFEAITYANGSRLEGQWTTAHTNRDRQQRANAAKEIQIHGERYTPPFERGWRRIAMSPPTANNGWWANEPGVGRMVHGLAHRNDRIAAIGDGQVPAVVKLAWETLSQ